MAPARRRISYVIPPPTDPVPRFQLPPYGVPRVGSTKPLLIPLNVAGDTGASKSNGAGKPSSLSHPRHRLGVASLALDSSTQLAGRSTPEGILYTAGRDGLVISWDLEMPMRKRSSEYMHNHKGHWEMMTGWGDDVIDEENEDDSGSDGDLLGDVSLKVRKKRSSIANDQIPYEHQWELESDAFVSGKPSRFRQCAQMHSDWVNDILLSNQNQIVVTASSDGTVKVWNPHSNSLEEPSVVGSHSDYVRCLSQCRDQNWIASGSFDRTIKLWDPSRGSTSGAEPLITLKSPEVSGPKASVYALAVDPYGSVIASGSPERVVRTWDPRSGKRTNKLVGHTDNIRAILISDDGKYLLTGSSDASVKLWSLATLRCIHTFTQHTESVWSLFSSHPTLETFYSGDRSGLVCRVDVEGCSDVSEGECIVLCQDINDKSLTSTEGINKILVMDDEILWTASGSSSVKRWNIPQRRSVRAPGSYPTKSVETPILLNSPLGLDSARAFTPPPLTDHSRLSVTPSGSMFAESSGIDGGEMLYSIPLESLVRLSSANDSFAPFGSASRGRDPEVATLYSAASIMSVPRVTEVRLQAVFQQQSQQSAFTSNSPKRSDTVTSRGEETLHPLNTARADYEEREVASDAVPLLSTPDDIIYGTNGLVRTVILNDRMHALTVDTTGEVAVWDIIRSACLGRFAREDVAAASNSNSTTNGNGSDEREQSPREALETVKERIEGEAFVISWSAVDTKTGVLTVHLNEKCFETEIYADEAGYGPERHFNDETRLNVGKWVLRNLFIGFVREQQRALSRRNREAHEQSHHRSLHKGSGPAHIETNNGHTSPTSRGLGTDSSRTPDNSLSNMVLASPSMIPALSPQLSKTKTSPHLTPVISLRSLSQDVPLPSIPQSPNPHHVGNDDATSMAVHPLTASATQGSAKDPTDYFNQPQRSRSGSVTVAAVDEFGSKSPSPDTFASTPPTGGFMGRLRNFTRSTSRRHASETGVVTPVTAGGTSRNSVGSTSEDSVDVAKAPMTPLQLLLNSISIPPSTEAPTVPIPTHTSIIISEESTFGWTTVYRSVVAHTGADVRVLEEVMPMWLLEYLLINKVPNNGIVKVGFVLLPYPSQDEREQLPELLNTSQSKLTASRFLRVRKLTAHVQDKLERMAATQQRDSSVSGTVPPSPSPRNSLEHPNVVNSRSSTPTATTSPTSRTVKAEDLFEILCNDVVLPYDMTLAAVRQYVWRQAGELTMHYRRKPGSASLLQPLPQQPPATSSVLVQQGA